MRNKHGDGKRAVIRGRGKWVMEVKGREQGKVREQGEVRKREGKGVRERGNA